MVKVPGAVSSLVSMFSGGSSSTSKASSATASALKEALGNITKGPSRPRPSSSSIDSNRLDGRLFRGNYTVPGNTGSKVSNLLMKSSSNTSSLASNANRSQTSFVGNRTDIGAMSNGPSGSSGGSISSRVQNMMGNTSGRGSIGGAGSGSGSSSSAVGSGSGSSSSAVGSGSGGTGSTQGYKFGDNVRGLASRFESGSASGSPRTSPGVEDANRATKDVSVKDLISKFSSGGSDSSSVGGAGSRGSGASGIGGSGSSASGTGSVSGSGAGSSGGAGVAGASNGPGGTGSAGGPGGLGGLGGNAGGSGTAGIGGSGGSGAGSGGVGGLSPGASEAARVIPGGTVSSRVAGFEAMGQGGSSGAGGVSGGSGSSGGAGAAGSAGASGAGGTSGTAGASGTSGTSGAGGASGAGGVGGLSPGAAEAASVIPKGTVSGRVSQFEAMSGSNGTNGANGAAGAPGAAGTPGAAGSPGSIPSSADFVDGPFGGRGNSGGFDTVDGPRGGANSSSGGFDEIDGLGRTSGPIPSSADFVDGPIGGSGSTGGASGAGGGGGIALPLDGTDQQIADTVVTNAGNSNYEGISFPEQPGGTQGNTGTIPETNLVVQRFVEPNIEKTYDKLKDMGNWMNNPNASPENAPGPLQSNTPQTLNTVLHNKEGIQDTVPIPIATGNGTVITKELGPEFDPSSLKIPLKVVFGHDGIFGNGGIAGGGGTTTVQTDQPGAEGTEGTKKAPGKGFRNMLTSMALPIPQQGGGQTVVTSPGGGGVNSLHLGSGGGGVVLGPGGFGSNVHVISGGAGGGVLNRLDLASGVGGPFGILRDRLGSFTTQQLTHLHGQLTGIKVMMEAMPVAFSGSSIEMILPQDGDTTTMPQVKLVDFGNAIQESDTGGPGQMSRQEYNDLRNGSISGVSQMIGMVEGMMTKETSSTSSTTTVTTTTTTGGTETTSSTTSTTSTGSTEGTGNTEEEEEAGGESVSSRL